MRNINIGTLNLSPKAKRYVNEALDNNRLSYGPFAIKFEALFAQKHQSKYAVCSSSGTAALQMAIAALKEKYQWPDNSEVIVPATTFIATSNAVILNNLKPVFVEIDPLYYGLDPELLEEKITPKTKAMIPVHLFGQPADMKPLMDIAKRKGLSVIEDSAETMLALYQGKCVGSFGDIACFSTYVAHLLTTGIGGINTTQDPELAITLRSLANHGRDSIYLNIDDDNEVSEEKLKMIVKKRFSFERIGLSSRITELECAIGLAQLESELEDQIEKRRYNAAYLNEKLKPYEDILQLPQTRPGNEHSFMMYPLVLRNIKKDNLVQHLENAGIETRDLMPLINQPIYNKLFNIKKTDYPISQWLINSGFYVGCHQELSVEDLDYLASKIINFIVS
jgi:perosamine synthetase